MSTDGTSSRLSTVSRDGGDRRRWSPPKQDLVNLRQSLTKGELQVIACLDALLNENWEFYVQPYLNGCRPDLVLVNPHVGIAVFEVKDWSLSTLSYQAASHRDSAWIAVREGRAKRAARSPIAQVVGYKEEIHRWYCPSLSGDLGQAAITAGVIFTQAKTDDVRHLLEPELVDLHPRYHPVAGSDALARHDLETIFPEGVRTASSLMTESAVSDLRMWLAEPAHAAEQRTPLSLSTRQRELTTTRTATGLRRIRGPAGSGKTLVLAARAAEILRSRPEAQVLVVSFNHTLRSYIRDLVVRFGARPNTITWLGFHEWCRRTLNEAGRSAAYKQLWKEHSPGEILDELLPQATNEALEKGPTASCASTYDAVLIDEGQDFEPSWWNALRKVVRTDGEMVLVADRAQDLYGRSQRWTDEAMTGAGFSGPWNELDDTYRLPFELLAHLEAFCRKFVPEAQDAFPALEAQLDLPYLTLAWHQVDGFELAERVAEEARRLATSDLCVLVDTKDLGVAVVERLNDHGIATHHTFSENERVERVLKRTFFRGDARVKVTTVHSFKGWESPRLVVGVGCDAGSRLIYTALTRLQANDVNCTMTVVCSDERFAEYGSSWGIAD